MAGSQDAGFGSSDAALLNDKSLAEHNHVCSDLDRDDVDVVGEDGGADIADVVTVDDEPLPQQKTVDPREITNVASGVQQQETATHADVNSANAVNSELGAVKTQINASAAADTMGTEQQAMTQAQDEEGQVHNVVPGADAAALPSTASEASVAAVSTPSNAGSSSHQPSGPVQPRPSSSFAALLSAELQTSRPAPPSSLPLPARNEAKAAAAAAAAAVSSAASDGGASPAAVPSSLQPGGAQPHASAGVAAHAPGKADSASHLPPSPLSPLSSSPLPASAPPKYHGAPAAGAPLVPAAASAASLPVAGVVPAASPPVPWGQVSVNLRAFNLFAARIRPEVRAANPHLSGPEIERAIGQRWNSLGPPAREEFLQAAREERAALIAAGLLDPNARPRRRRRKRAEIEADNMLRLQQQQLAAAARATAAGGGVKGGGDGAAAALRRLQQLQGAGRGRGKGGFPVGSAGGIVGEGGAGEGGAEDGEWPAALSAASVKRDPEEVLRLLGGVAVGQRTEAVIEGAFGSGLFVAVHLPCGDGEDDPVDEEGRGTTVLRGVVFVPGLAVPVAEGNDLAPGLQAEDGNMGEEGGVNGGGSEREDKGHGRKEGERGDGRQMKADASEAQEETEEAGDDGDGMDVDGVDGKEEHASVMSQHSHSHGGMAHGGAHAMGHAGLQHPALAHASGHTGRPEHAGHVAQRHDMAHVMAMGHSGHGPHSAVAHAAEVGHAVVGHAQMAHATMGHAGMGLAPHPAGLEMGMRASMMAMAPQQGAPPGHPLTYHHELVHHHMAGQAPMQAMRAVPPGMLPGMPYAAAGMPVLAGMPHAPVVQAHDMATAAAVAAAAAHAAAAAAAAGHAGQQDMNSADVDIDVVAGGGPMDDIPAHG